MLGAQTRKFISTKCEHQPNAKVSWCKSSLKILFHKIKLDVAVFMYTLLSSFRINKKKLSQIGFSRNPFENQFGAYLPQEHVYPSRKEMEKFGETYGVPVKAIRARIVNAQ